MTRLEAEEGTDGVGDKAGDTSRIGMASVTESREELGAGAG